MDYKVIDILRSPTVIVLDALLAKRFAFPWSSNPFISFAVTVLGSFASVFLFACSKSWLLKFYQFSFGLGILIFSTLLQTLLLASSYKFYNLSHPHLNQSVIYSVVVSTLEHEKLKEDEVDLSVKVAYYLIMQIALHKLFTTKFVSSTRKEGIPYFLALMLTCSSSLAALLNVPPNIFTTSVCLTLLPQFISLYLAFGTGFSYLHQCGTTQVRRLLDAIKEQGLAHFLENVWERLRVPQVLRLFFVFRWICVCFIVLSSTSMDMSIEGGTPPQGIFQYFSWSHYNEDLQTRSVTEKPHFSTSLNAITSPLDARANATNTTTSFYAVEHMAVMLTDSILSVFSIGSIISIPFYYCGILLHGFVGGMDLGHAESLGTVSAILFSLLAIQTGLTGLPPFLRLIRLYRNVCLHFAAVLHYAHDLVHPVLMSLSAQANIPVRFHVKPLFVALVLAIVPSAFCVWLVRTQPLSTWLIALTAFSIELIVKVIASLLLYVLYAVDARVNHRPWPNLDDWVFYVQSTSHFIEFTCGCVMFVNGAYVLLFESGSMLRAFMMTMHAYVNIYKAACDGLKALNNRRTVNLKITSLTLASQQFLEEHRDDVCSICYQNFTTDYGEVRITRCMHPFHPGCLRKWLFIQDTCPMCHQAIFGTDEKES